MSYIGSSATPLPVNFSAVQSQGFNGTGSQTTFTLNRSVGSAASVEVLVNNVQQSPYDGSYNITGGTSLVFSEAPSAGTNNVYVVYRDQALGSLVDTTAYRKAEVDSAVAAKVSKTGDTMTGRLTISAGADRSIDLLNSSGVAQGYIGVEGAFGGVPSNALRLRGEGGVVLGANGTAHLTCDSSGRVTMPYQPMFRCRGSGGAYAQASGQITAISQILENVGGNYSSSTHRFTAPTTGKYLFWVNLFGAGGSDRIGYAINGNNQTSPYIVQTFDNVVSGAIIVHLNANDYLTIFAQYGGSSIYLDHCGWGGYLLG